MQILFTKSDSVLSKAIRSTTGEEVSHVALYFPSLGIIVHSNLLGVHIEWAANFAKHATIVYNIDREDSLADHLKLARLLAEYEWAFYDFGALLFVGLSLTLRKYLKIPLPKSNLWQSSGMLLCTEFVEKFENVQEDAMLTPYGLYKLLKTTV